MDGSVAPFVVLLVGFIVLGLAALAGGVDSREFDTRSAPAFPLAEGD
jgi:hypothetical protein